MPSGDRKGDVLVNNKSDRGLRKMEGDDWRNYVTDSQEFMAVCASASAEVQHEVWTPRSWKKKFIEMMKEHEFQQSAEAEQDQGTEHVVIIDDEFARVRRNYCERQMFQEGDE